MNPCLYIFAAEALWEGAEIRPGVVETLRGIDWDHRSLAVLIDMRIVETLQDRDRMVEKTMDLVCRATSRAQDLWTLRPPLLLCPHAQVHVRLCGCMTPGLATFRAIARRSCLRADQMLYVAPADEQEAAAGAGVPFMSMETFFGQGAQERSVA